MLTYTLEVPKIINADKLAGELGYEAPLNGHGCSVVYDADIINAIQVIVRTEYNLGLPPNTQAKSLSITMEQVQEIVDSHVP